MIKKAVLIGLMLVLPFYALVNANGGVQADFSYTPAHPSTADNVQFTDRSTPQTGIVEWVWYFGDGHGSTAKNPTHRYTRPGTYTVKLTVVWNISGTLVADIVEKNITVENRPPVADAGPNQIVNTSTVTLDGSNSYDPDGNITSYKWDFGDGTTGNGKIVHHTYTNDGEYTVTLNVTDDHGASDEDTCTVTVDTHPPLTRVNISGEKGNNGWYKGNVTVKLTSTDNQTGVRGTFYRIDNGNWTRYSNQFVISGEGEHLLEYYSVDNVFNHEEVKNVTIKIDKTKPYVEIAQPKDRKLYIFGRAIIPTLRTTIIIGKIEVLINATDAISGIEKVSILVDNVEKANLTSPPYEWRWGGNIGRHTLKVIAYDEAGWSKSQEISAKIYSLFGGSSQAEAMAKID